MPDKKRYRSPEQKAKRAAWFRDYYATKLRIGRSRQRGNPWALMREPGELGSLRLLSELDRHIEQVDRARIALAFCGKCGSHRIFSPDSDGRCRMCQRRKRLAHKKRAQASGKWGIRARLAKHRRRALKKANGGAGHVSTQDWQDVLAKYGTACLCCGSNDPPTMDHVVPLALGGPHDKTNLQPLCHLCNSLKADTVADYRFDRPLAPMARDPNVVRYVPGTD